MFFIKERSTKNTLEFDADYYYFRPQIIARLRNTPICG